jgi:hypothetical protein
MAALDLFLISNANSTAAGVISAAINSPIAASMGHPAID